MIKIISGHSYPSASTLALVNLCIQFNSRGYACILYGPDGWHADKCRSAKLSEFSPESGDIVIVNNVAGWPIGNLLNISPLVKKNRRKQFLRTMGVALIKFLPSLKSSNYKLILTCHEGNALPSLLTRISRFNKIHFTGRSGNMIDRCFRMVYPVFIAPNFSSELNKLESRSTKIAGVIGDIVKENKIEFAIEQALLDGMETVIMFGAMKDPEYYYDKITPLTKKYSGKIKYAGFIDDRQKMYGTVSHAYSAVKKPWDLVGHECAMTNTQFHAPGLPNDDCRMTNDQIFEIWKHELAI
jgi:hypothetical protein